MNTRERIFSVCVTHSVKLPVAALLPLAGRGTHVMYVCLDEDFSFNCGENRYNTILGEVNELCLTEYEVKFRTFRFPSCSPSPLPISKDLVCG